MNKHIIHIVDLFYNLGHTKKLLNERDLIIESVNNFYLNEEDEENIQDLDDDSDIEDGYESELDKAYNGEEMKTTELLRSNVPTIYAFITEKIPDMIKIGYTDQGALTRLKQWQKHYPDAKLIGHWNSVEYNIANLKVFFKDYPVHARVNAKGFALINDEEKEMFKQLEINKGLIDMHVSSEFFHKYKNISETETEELSELIIEDIINELKKDIRTNNNISDVGLYTINSTGDSVKSDTIWKAPNTFLPTDLLQDCIEAGVNAIKAGDHDLLMAAVMRFGKTASTYWIIKKAKIKYALVASAKADVRPAWRNDINHVDFIDDFAFLEFLGNNPNVVTLSMKYPGEGDLIKTKEDIRMYNDEGVHIIDLLRDLGKTVIVFATLQDLSGNLKENEEFDFNNALFESKTHIIKEKHQYLFDNPPEIMVIDETHYGSHSQTLGAATGLKQMSEDEYTKEEIKNAREEVKKAEEYNNVVTAIKAPVTLQCSGTPYYILLRGEFAPTIEGKTIISKVSFTDMINARDEWAASHSEDELSKSPYYGIPNIFKYGMQLSKKCRKELQEEGINTNMTKLFELDENKLFIHEDAIIELMVSIFGKENNKKIGFLNKKLIIDGEIFKHTLLVLPRIDACTALANLLREKNIIDENDREVIVLVEKKTKKSEGGRQADAAARNVDTLNDYLNMLEDNGKHSLMITVNRFLTGVSIPLADSMLYMKSAKSPLEYDQAIFRLCTRNVREGSNGEKVNMKPNVYLIDFDIDRLFLMTIKSAVAQCAANEQSSPDEIEAALALQLETVPIISEDHVMDNPDLMKGMHEINSEDLLKKYAKYNKDKDIESSIKDMMDLKVFDNFTSNLLNIDLVRNFNKGTAERSGLDLELGHDEVSMIRVNDADADTAEDQFDFNGVVLSDIYPDINPEGLDSTDDEESKKYLVDMEKARKRQEKAILDEIKDKLIGMLKNILYCNICLDLPCKDINKFINLLKTDENARLMAKDFKIQYEDLINVYDALTYNEKANINVLLLNMYTLMNEESLKPIERVLVAIKKLGRLDDKKADDAGVALVVTPEELADKMVAKITLELMDEAENILEVNSKTGEFMLAIYRRFGLEAAKKVLIVPGDNRCKAIIRKVLNILGIDESNILIVNDSENYNVKDFLEADNEEILSHLK